MAHHHIQGLNGILGNLPRAPFQSLLKGVQRHLRRPFHCNPEYPVLALSWKGNLQIYRFIANRKRIPRVQVASAVKDRLSVAEDLAVGIHHGLDDVAIHLSWALVWLNADVVVMYVPSGHSNLKVVSLEHDWTTFATQIRSARTSEDRLIRTGAVPSPDYARYSSFGADGWWEATDAVDRVPGHDSTRRR